LSGEDNKALYRRYNARCNAHGFESLDEFVAEGVVVNGEPVGLAGYREGLAAVASAFPDYRWRLDHLLAEDDWLAAHFADSGTHRGTFLDVPPTGKAVETQEFAFYRLEGGKIVEVWVTADDLATLRQLKSRSEELPLSGDA
jgi:predicted ester cyclase